jgi:3-deoxy-7-phosphoheptulonate synthase
VSIPSLDALHQLRPPQQPSWPDDVERDRVVARLRKQPPLVFAGECDNLRAKLAQVAAGKAFLLQGGDCAETFDGVTAENVRNKLQVLLSMAVVLTYAGSVPVVKLGRLAGSTPSRAPPTTRRARA